MGFRKMTVVDGNLNPISILPKYTKNRNYHNYLQARKFKPSYLVT